MTTTLPSLDFVEHQPSLTADAAVIWLHGLGADGHDFLPIVPELELKRDSVRFIFPHAPIRPVTLNAGMEMRAWFDIKQLSQEADVDYEEIEATSLQIRQLIDRQVEQGISKDRIIVAGFSQGGAIALYVGLTQPQSINGVMALSTYLPASAPVPEASAPLDIFVAHGQFDAVLPQSFGEQTYQRLKQLGYQASWHSYAMEHSVCVQELADISAWLNQKLF